MQHHDEKKIIIVFVIFAESFETKIGWFSEIWDEEHFHIFWLTTVKDLGQDVPKKT